MCVHSETRSRPAGWRGSGGKIYETKKSPILNRSQSWNFGEVVTSEWTRPANKCYDARQNCPACFCASFAHLQAAAEVREKCKHSTTPEGERAESGQREREESSALALALAGEGRAGELKAAAAAPLRRSRCFCRHRQKERSLPMSRAE